MSNVNSNAVQNKTSQTAAQRQNCTTIIFKNVECQLIFFTKLLPNGNITESLHFAQWQDLNQLHDLNAFTLKTI